MPDRIYTDVDNLRLDRDECPHCEGREWEEREDTLLYCVGCWAIHPAFESDMGPLMRD